MSTRLTTLQDNIGYSFKDKNLLVLAMTHRSFNRINNERLEFLGDAILNFIIGDLLFTIFPQAQEGQLSQFRSKLVKEETLAILARSFNLGKYLLMGAGELKSCGFTRDAILADAIEALIGAIYLDIGIVESVREIIFTWFRPKIYKLNLIDLDLTKDPKTRLQEFLQSRGFDLPMYEIVDIKGEPHKRIFFVDCKISILNNPTTGYGSCRRIAEQSAAYAALGALSHYEN